jgi:hypothetical protein
MKKVTSKLMKIKKVGRSSGNASPILGTISL